ncbi:transcription termination/antitermination protein NusG [Anaerocolumna cellulosilytica]|uniref:Transcription termination/antitermination protein NusG n=1 Tax=Anaerocolumna cellulosilytica TaxID=433286 RepID=A0A6S6R4I8_9FIRM|nr:antiterminator LoaP [Anaerocolumna cellulosilytica]MBB5194717.1 transcriptional antiterminator NusG [Anaerocolumna cellulosilytica]BCJ94320.1 transcription termination/antitermination protein NusG [Anaerocolumna cellulosilytica]
MNWYAIFVETGFEDEVCLFINKRKIQIYNNIEYNLLVPKRRIYERKQGVRREVTKIMFPGYVLLETNNINEFYSRTRGGPHIIKFLKNNYNFLEVGVDEIKQILHMVDQEGFINISQALIMNDRIKIMEGPLLGQEGIIKKIDKRKGRAKVQFTINYNTLLIDLGIDIIQKIEASS